MIYRIFSVYDSKVEAFMKPFYCVSKGEAIRSFSEIANDKTSSIGKYPEDFALFDLGSFDDSCATFECGLVPVSIGLAIEFVKS